MDQSRITQHRRRHLPYLRIESFVLVRGVRLGDPSSGGRVLHHGGLVVLPSELRAVIVHVEDDDSDDARSGERRRAYGHGETRCETLVVLSSGGHKDNRRHTDASCRRSSSASSLFFYYLSF